MSTPYVFWRMPTGKPYRGTDRRYALTQVLSEIGRTAKQTDSGITWNTFWIERLETSLKPALAVVGPDGEELNEPDRWNIVLAAVRTAITKRGGERPITPEELLAESNLGAAAYFRMPLSRFTLLSSLSIRGTPAKVVRVRDAQIRLADVNARRYEIPAALQFQHRMHPPGLSRYQRVSVDTEGRTHDDAVDRALFDLHLLRGIWTLVGSSNSWRRSFGTKVGPLAVIHVGPIHTLHSPDGKSVIDGFWHESSDLEQAEQPFCPAKGWDECEKLRKWAQRRIRSLKYGKDLQDLIVKYAVAIDQKHLDVTFLHLWSLLERITDTIGANYDETINRAVWAYRDRSIAAELLQSLRMHRNQLVHAGRSGQDQEGCAYLVKSFVEPHLIRLIRNDFEVTSLAEYAEHLRCPTDVETLRHRIKRLNTALRFLKPRKKVS